MLSDRTEQSEVSREETELSAGRENTQCGLNEQEKKETRGLDLRRCRFSDWEEGEVMSRRRVVAP